eukprot:15358377-Ditylum_brightwellii.AAC.1
MEQQQRLAQSYKVRRRRRQFLVALGSRKTIGNKRYFHSYSRESLAASWAASKNRYFLWGRSFTIISDQWALKWITQYKGNSHTVISLQMDLLNMSFSMLHRRESMTTNADFISRLGEMCTWTH